MDPHKPRICHWEGCRSFDVILGGVYCPEHKTQHYQGRRPQSDKNQAFSSSSSNPPLGLPRNSLGINPFFSGTPSPTNEKKQLPDKHTARKSVKQPSNSGQAHIASATSPVRKPSVDTLPGNPRPVKRQRPPGVPNVPGLYPRSDSSSFSENGIPHVSSRGMFRQSEERTYKLSAVDDFALRPKKKEAANESARSKPYNDHRQLHRGDSHLSKSSRAAPASSKPPQNSSLKGNVRSASFVIDLTRDDDPEPPLPRPKPQPSPKSHAPNGITAGLQKPQRSSDGNPNLLCEQKDVPASGNKQRREGPPPSQPGGISQAHHGRFVEQARDLHTQKALQNVVPSSPTVQPASKAPNGTSPEAPISKQKPNIPALSNGLGPVHMNSSDTSTHEHDLPPIKDRPLTNGIHHSSLNEKNTAPVNSSASASVTEQTMAKKPTKTSVQRKPIPNAPPQPQAPGIAPLQQTAIPRGPLSALLGGREWKKMSPEERRLFWVSQHDAEKLDAQIYSENNRPFRPGDALFGVADDALPPRPQRAAKHFDYIDPRTHYSHQQSEEWYQQKQKEISARGNRKRGLGEAIKRAVQRKRGVSKPNQKRKRDSLPQCVLENPKWLKALEVLEQIEAQVRHNKETSQPQREKTAKGKEKATATVELDSDTDMQSS
ncbi:hypothetical protein F4801DRAFT_463750 [Xylaria longipes]|nr:hypothetical protein F4801DRAFT_463750 [Xylaria longipes]RYC66184.1 hypothetical protein CHU98_g94 [Xylaria longipes]